MIVRDTTNAIGFWTAVALVMGNMIGSGVFLLPAALAPYGGLALGGWIVSAAGSICLALVFAQLARLSPDAGGPYAFTRRSFGDLPGFLVAWGYWVSIWCANAALATAFVGYLAPFVPGMTQSPWLAALLAVSVVWLMTLVNITGVRAAGRLQVATTVLKILPLLLIGVVGLAFMTPSHFAVNAESIGSTGEQLMATVTLTLWAFLGLECATIPAGSVSDPQRTIPRATIVGTLLAGLIFILSTVGVMGVVPNDILRASTAPFADAAGHFWGDVGAALISAGAAISCLGALNGWILMVGQLPLAVAKDGLFPAVFMKVGRRGTPVAGTVIGGTLSTLLVAMNYSGGLVSLFTKMILLSTLSTLVAYVFCSLALFLRGDERHVEVSRPPGGIAAVSIAAFLFTMVAIAGAGTDTVYWGFLLLVAGLPVYTWVVRQRRTPDLE
jgi:APA family basic amino acid/polyamine antiporter